MGLVRALSFRGDPGGQTPEVDSQVRAGWLAAAVSDLPPDQGVLVFGGCLGRRGGDGEKDGGGEIWREGQSDGAGKGGGGWL